MTNAEIQVGEYVRTKEGYIAKCTCKGGCALAFDNTVKTNYGETKDWLFQEDNEITNHSFNLIDLIEVGDYVNGNRVVNVINKEPCPSGKCVDIDSAKQSEDCTFWEEDIKTIVTHEQFKSMEYKVGGEDENNI